VNIAIPTGVEYTVPAFAENMDWNSDFLKIPPPSLLPMAGYREYNHDQMDKSIFDDNLTPMIAVWLKNFTRSGENGLIGRDDALLNIYCYLAGLTGGSRNQKEDSTIFTTRSDRTDQYDGVTVVRIEEKDVSMAEAVDDLRNKSCWLPHYERLPFIFGIAITRTNLNIYTLSRDTTNLKFSTQLDDMSNRWKCVVAVINIARTLKLFIDKNWIYNSLPFNTWHERNNKKIRLEDQFVQVEYPDDQTFARMIEFYNATATVHHLEHLQDVSMNRRRIKLVPVGVQRKPFNLAELIAALKDITECLLQLHQCGYVHCDVRWSNLIVLDGRWYLIDCEYACKLNENDALLERSSKIRPKYVLNPTIPWGHLSMCTKLLFFLRNVT
jgi:hypothetical protein